MNTRTALGLVFSRRRRLEHDAQFSYLQEELVRKDRIISRLSATAESQPALIHVANTPMNLNADWSSFNNGGI